VSTTIGTFRTRPDAAAKVSGRTAYTADVALDGVLAGVVVRSPHPFARIKRLDAAAALAMPGVAAVAHRGTTPAAPLDFGIKDQHLFPREYVRYEGEPVAAVAADSVEQARAAAAGIEIEYEPLEPVLTIDDALRPGGALVHPDWQTYEKGENRFLERNVCGRNRIRRGDVDAAFSTDGAVVVESSFEFSAGMPGYLEPRAAIARREPGGGLTVWCGSQSPCGNRDDLAAFFGLDAAKVRFINQFVGGGFGGKILMAAEWYAAALALQCDRPVRVAWSRREDCLNVFPRHGGRARLKTAAAADGTLLAMRASFAFDTGAYIGYGAGSALIATMLASAPYRIPNIDLEAMLVYTNKQVAGPVRAPGGPQANYAKEAHLDELAAALGIDPLEFRLKNAWVEGDASPTGQRLTSVSVKETLRKAADAIGWGTALAAGRGRGICCTWWFSSCTESRARVEILESGAVRLHSGNPEVGTGSAASALPMFAADALGIDPSTIDVVLADTASDAFDGGVGGSGSTYGSGMAVERAAIAARDAVIRRAEDALEARAEDIELLGGRAYVRGTPEHGATFAQLARAAGGTIEGRGESDGGEDPEFDASLVESHGFASWMAPSFTTTAAEVDVDRETGRVAVRRLVTAQDVGFAVNPTGVVGQIEGGAVQGLGWALMERIDYDGGQMVNSGFAGYLLPTAVDAPPIEAIIVESPSREGPRGMKGAGEPPVTTPAGAIANAIRDAVGVTPHHAPMTPERVWAAINGR
jgi:CO/xanthine dehydrogenase Mo-binding subunit